MAKKPKALRATTPKTVSGEIRSFCESINSDSEPYYVDVAPGPSALPRRCHPNVSRQIEEHGGEAITGWIIWEARFWLEAEFHSIWADHDHNVFDVTPKEDGETSVLFLPDASLEWQSYVVPSRRMPKVQDPLLEKWVALHSKCDSIRRKYRENEKFTPIDNRLALGLIDRANQVLTAFIEKQKRRQAQKQKKQKKRR